MDSDNELNSIHTHERGSSRHASQLAGGRPREGSLSGEKGGKNFIDRIFSWRLLSALVAVSLIAVGYMISERANFTSADVSILIDGPKEFKAQAKVNFEVGFVNNSDAEISSGTLYVNLPEFMAFEDSEEIEKKIEFSGVKSRGKFTESISVVSKESNTEGTLKVRAEYIFANFGKSFTSEGSENFYVTSLPITVIFSIPDKVVSGQTLAGSFDFVADESLEAGEVYAKLEMPEEFTLIDSEPGPADDNIWKFENVKPSGNYRVDFEGTIRGKEGDIKDFKLMFGKPEDFGAFASQYETSKSVRISSSPLGIVLEVNGKKGEYIASAGEKLNFNAVFENKSGVEIDDITLAIQLVEAGIFDFNTIDAGGGFFNKETKTVVWNKNFLPSLDSLKDGDSGDVGFSVSIKKAILPQNYKDKNISVSAIAVMEPSKTPLSLKGLSLRSEGEIRVKLRTNLGISSKAYYYEGPFTNSGPIPPKAGEKTTYTVVWQIENTTNDAKDAQVVAALPNNIDFENKIYPDGAILEYDSNTHTVTWTVGDLAAGVGSVFPPESAAFQISITPSEDNRGRISELMGSAKVIATDDFTGEFIEGFDDGKDTTLPDDAGMKEGDGIIQ